MKTKFALPLLALSLAACQTYPPGPGYPGPGYPQGVAPLLRRLRDVRRQGYVLLPADVTGSDPSLAVPVGDPASAAVALAGKGVDRQVDDLLPQLREVARRIAE